MGYNQVVKVIRVGIIHTDHPYKILTNQQMQIIQDLVPDLICAAPAEGTHPKFCGICEKPDGWLQLRCVDESTSKWLLGKAGQLKPDQQTYIKVVAESDIPKLAIVIGYFPKSESHDNAKILAMIEAQNPPVITTKWRVLNRIQEGMHTCVSFSIDSQSMEKIKRLNHIVSFKFGEVSLLPNKKETHSGTTPP